MAGLREMTIEDYDQVYRLWNLTDGLAISDAESKENIEYESRRYS